MIRAHVIVRPRASIFDPQGDAVHRAIQHLGVSAVKQAHVGKFIELELDATDVKAIRAQLETICQDLLSNPVIEDYTLTLQPVSAAGSTRVKAAVAKTKAKVNGAVKKPTKAKKKKAKPSVKIAKFKKGRKK